MLNKTFIEKTFPGKNSSDLVFIRNSKEIDLKFISIVNDTTISMYIEKPPPAKAMYFCYLKLDGEFSKPYEAVCLNTVSIGCKYFSRTYELLSAYQHEVKVVMYKNYGRKRKSWL